MFRGRVVLGLAAASFFFLVACTSNVLETPTAGTTGSVVEPMEAAPTFDTEGSLLVTSYGVWPEERFVLVKYLDSSRRACEGVDAAKFARQGADVTVRNSQDEIVALGRLNQGEVATGTDEFMVECRFSFALEDVPESDFYTVEIGTLEPKRYTAGELQKGIRLTMK